MKKLVIINTAFLGVSMFAFGALKFINPFKAWYQAQVEMSELPFPALSYWFGQIGEILVGVVLLLTLFPGGLKKTGLRRKLFVGGNALVIAMMLVAFYVHMHPDVPTSVLPLKIRPPFIPGFFLLLALVNIGARHTKY